MSFIDIDHLPATSIRSHFSGQPNNEQSSSDSDIHQHLLDTKYVENVPEIHGKANRVYASRGREDPAKRTSQDFCPCCNLLREGKPLSLWCNLSELYHLGTGYALYFRLVRYGILLLLLMFITGGTYNALTNFTGDNCGSSPEIDYCSNNYISIFGIANKRDQQKELEMQLYLNLMTIIVVTMYIQYVRHRIRWIESQADARTITPSDYTVKLTGNILTKDKTEFDLKEKIEKFRLKQKTLEIKKITRAYDLTNFKKPDTQEVRMDTESEIPEERSRSVLEEPLKAHQPEKLDYVRTAFVTFQTAEEADEIVRYFRRVKVSQKLKKAAHFFSSKAEILDGKRVKIMRAPEPSDVVWQNLGYHRRNKIVRRLKTNLLTAVTVVFGFILVVILSTIQRKIIILIQDRKEIDNTWEIQIITIVGAILTTMINFKLSMQIKQFVDNEKRSTKTSFYKGVAEKLSGSQIINTAFTTLLAKIFVTVFFAEGGIGDVQLLDFYFYGEGGAVEAMFSLFISNVYIGPLYNLLDPFYLYKKFGNFWKKITLRKDPLTTEFTEEQKYAIYAGEPYDIAYKNATLIKTVLGTCFFAPAIPAVLLVGAFGLITMYWINKYLLLRRAALPPAIGAELTASMVEYLQWASFMFAAGNAFFYYTLQRSDLTLAFNGDQANIVWIGILVSLINIILPMKYINRFLFKIDEEGLTEKTYDEVKATFYSNYDIENPVTREKALRFFKEKIEKRRQNASYVNDVQKSIADKISQESVDEIL